MAKRIKWWLVKLHRSYTVDEASRLLDIGKPSVRRWINQEGLAVIDNKKPFLIRGLDLKAFSKAKQKPKQRCKLYECYCLKCRTPRKPAFSEVEITRSSQSTEMMTGLCYICSCVMFKRISKSQIPQVEAILNVTFKQAPEPINDSPLPCSNVNLKKEETNE